MTTNSSTALSDLEAARRPNGEFGTQTHEESGIVDFVMPPGTHYVFIQTEDEDTPDIFVGPYPSEIAAQRAMDNSVLIQSLCEEDCVECFISDLKVDPGWTPSNGAERIVPDSTPSNTGEIDVADLIDELRKGSSPWVDVDDYQGSEGDKFAVEVWQVARKLTDMEDGRDWQLVVDWPGEFNGEETDYLGSIGYPQVGFQTNDRASGFTITRVTRYEDLTLDPNAKGAAQVESIAKALMGLRDKIATDFNGQFDDKLKER